MEGAGVSPSDLKVFAEAFENDPKNIIVQNICATQDLNDVCLNRQLGNDVSHIFNKKVSAEGRPITNQKGSGRCWIFACLNVIRIPFMKKFNLEDFEFSQTQVFFWDKLERCNYLLRAYVEIARNKEPADGRLLGHLLSSPNPCDDGGQWDMLVNVIEKHGLVPKKCWPECKASEATIRLRRVLDNQMRENCMKLREMVEKGQTDTEINQRLKKMLEDIYRILCISLGSPSETITWQYYNKSKEYMNVGPISPLEFYRTHVKPVYNLEDKICIVNDPRPQNPYGNMYTVEYLGNMNKGRMTLYNNQPIELLKEVAKLSITNDEAVWYGCDVGKHFNRKNGFNDLKAHAFEMTLGTTLLGMCKGDRLIYHESMMTHAMVLTAVHIENDKPTRWRVENSWGEEGDGKGYLVMTDDWFTEFVYEVVVDRKYVPQEVLDVQKLEPKVLPAWDPMGSLA